MMDMHAAEVIKDLASKDVGFYASHDIPGGQATVHLTAQQDLRELLTHAIPETIRDSGGSRLSTVGGLVSKTHTSFDPRNYGFKKLSELVRAQPYLDVVDAPDGTGFVHVEVRLK
ncbi:OST-HTH/LOTUS domain-containing protein [Variovorax sp. PAMC26660]|uniref:OST-HTH/LOTUS domain-containing protein n=1 Tax=Variovorax sp. PAMC26660 TaxID=2762322 RepID=UPI00164D07B0|nr:OST-HTH/LOTUS domain-containing protein [Variovorax sp. PAMC26660]QNK67622.1 hypothetical protein H7F35_31530 [Variovorax sp. PAMC26660]